MDDKLNAESLFRDIFEEEYKPQNKNAIVCARIEMEPPRTTSQGKRIARTAKGIKVFRSPEHERDIGRLRAALRPHKPVVAALGALGLTLTYVYPLNAAERAKARGMGGTTRWHHTRPDCDNIAKGFIDVLQELGFFANDSQVAQLTVEKFRGPVPCIMFNLYRLDGQPND